MSKFMWLTVGIVCGVAFATSVQAMDTKQCPCTAGKPKDSQQTSQEQISQARDRVVESLHELKSIMGTRAPREPGMCPPGQCYPMCPDPIDGLLEQIQCILCSLKCHPGTLELCQIDHIEDWIALIEAIACEPVRDPRLPRNICDALAQLADGLTELLYRVGCPDCEMSMPDDILGRLCFVASQIEVIDEKVNVIESKVIQIDDAVENLVPMVGNIACNIGERCEQVDCAIINQTNCDVIMELDLSVIQWLKAIFAKIK